MAHERVKRLERKGRGKFELNIAEFASRASTYGEARDAYFADGR